jgi:hypothetical protein
MAQIQLVPGTQASHPKEGKAGDLYVDKPARLWFCKVGGTTATWAQVMCAGHGWPAPAAGSPGSVYGQPRRCVMPVSSAGWA